MTRRTAFRIAAILFLIATTMFVFVYRNSLKNNEPVRQRSMLASEIPKKNLVLFTKADQLEGKTLVFNPRDLWAEGEQGRLKFYIRELNLNSEAPRKNIHGWNYSFEGKITSIEYDESGYVASVTIEVIPMQVIELPPIRSEPSR